MRAQLTAEQPFVSVIAAELQVMNVFAYNDSCIDLFLLQNGKKKTLHIQLLLAFLGVQVTII